MSYYRDQMEAWLKTLDIEADMVLDIGGAAKPIDTRVNSWKVKDYFILDNEAEGQLDESRLVLTDYYQGQMKLDLNYGSWKIDKQFDAIFCLEVFEYIYDPVQAINHIFDLLKPGGKLYITFPFAYPLHNPSDKDFLRYTKSGVLKYLEGVGFKSENIKIKDRNDKSGLLKRFYFADGMHPARGEQFNHDATGFLVEVTK